MYNPITLPELKENYPAFDWEAYFKQVGTSTLTNTHGTNCLVVESALIY